MGGFWGVISLLNNGERALPLLTQVDVPTSKESTRA